MATQKKSKIAQEREEEARALWRWLASHFDARRLVFVDESGFHTSMTRLRARAPRGKRAYGKVPRNRGKNTTLIAAITLEGAMGESMSVEGATDSVRPSKPTLSTSLHPLFVRGRWWCSMGWGLTGPRG
jgi:DDE superfamily endonuclease